MTLDLDAAVKRAKHLKHRGIGGSMGEDVADDVLALVEELRQLREAVDTYVLPRVPAEKAAE